MCSENNAILLLSTISKGLSKPSCVRRSTQSTFSGGSAPHSHALLGFFMHVSVIFEWSLVVNTLGDWVGVFVLYTLSERSYSPETPEGDLHALGQLRANQIHLSASEHLKNALVHKNKHTEKLSESSKMLSTVK